MRIPAVGPIPALALPGDRRFSYYAHVPRRPATGGPVVVAVHGSDRDATGTRAAMTAWAEENGVTVLAPLFPAGLARPDDVDDYKYVETAVADHGGVLDAMVDDATARFACSRDFGLVGFSGGAQFVNRYLLLRPERLWAACVCAPGNVTLLDPALPWWRGTGGRAVDPEAVARVPVHLVLGSDDDGGAVIHLDEDSPYWLPGANDAGRTRAERLGALEASLRAAGVPVTSEVVPHAGHEAGPLLRAAQVFLGEAMAAATSRTRGAATTSPGRARP